jgi:hypothetical protein
MSLFDKSHLIEGVVEQDPLTDKYFIRMDGGPGGKPERFDIEAALAKQVGKEVRFTLVSFENLAELKAMVEEGGAGGEITGLLPDNLPGFNVKRKS